MKSAFAIILLCITILSFGQNMPQDSVKTSSLDTVVMSSNNLRVFNPPLAQVSRQIKYANPAQSLNSTLRANLGLFTRDNGATGLSTLSYKGVGSMQTPIVLEGANMQSSMNGMMDLNLIESFHFDFISVGSPDLTATGTQNIGEAISIAARNRSPELSILVGSSTQLDKNLGVKFNNKKGNWSYGLSALVGQSPNMVNLEHYGIDSFQVNTDYKKASALQKIEFHNQRKFSWTNTIYAQLSDRAIPPAFYVVAGSRQQDQNFMMVNNLSKECEIWDVDFTNQTWHETINFDDAAANESYLSQVLNINSSLTATRGFKKDWKLRLTAGNENAFYTSDAVQEDAQWNRLRASYSLSKRGKSSVVSIVQQVLVYDSAINMTGQVFYRKYLSRNLSFSSSLERLFRLPTLNELYWYQPSYAKGNPSLKPEEGYKADVSFKFSKMDYGFTINAFGGYYQNWIQWGGATERIPENIQSVLVKGAIFNAFYRRLINQKDLVAKLNVNWTQATYLFEDKSDSRNGQQIIYTPEITSNVFIGWSSRKFGIHVNQYFVSTNYVTSDNTSGIDPYFLTEIGGHYIHNNLRVGGAISNALDQPYFTQPRTPLPGRTLKININYTIPLQTWKEK